jgi:Allene oxide cyclase barrel like domain
VQLERDVRAGFVDNPPRRRETAGDVFTIRGRVRDAAGKAVGSTSAVFTQTGPRSARGGATFSLADGTIEVSGALRGRGADTLAIVGGTGAYAGVTGSVRITEGQRRTTFRFTLG